MEDREPYTKEMLSKSQMELTNPDFERLVMNKIRRASARKVFIKNLLLACLIVLTLETIIFLAVWYFPFSDFTPALIALPHHILPALAGLGGWIIENQIFILPLVILLIIGKIVESRFRFG